MRKLLTIFSILVAFSASAVYAQSGQDLTGGEGLAGQAEEEGGVYIPNAFTPNQDGINDEFYITNANFQKFSFAVFDRWGNQMYTANDPDFRWNGERNGNPVPTGTYVFVFEATNSKGVGVKRSGTISVMR